MQVEDRESGLGKLLQTRARAAPQSEEWKTADKELKKIDEIQRKRAKHDRHEQRLRALCVEPDVSGIRWNRPREVGQKAAYDFLMHAGNDYAVELQKIDPGLLKGANDQLLQELTTELPAPEWPPPLL
jgi:hypothetical protein